MLTKDQFHGQSTYWASFVNNQDIDDELRLSLEKELSHVNEKIVTAHTSFKDVAEQVNHLSELVHIGQNEPVTVDPVPADVYKALRYTKVNVVTASNAKIPIQNHGEGTQSLAVLLLFNAYLQSRLHVELESHSEPIIAIEEPEAHLHPNAIRGVWSVIQKLLGQKIVATHSGDILSEVPIACIRRLHRVGDSTHCKSISSDTVNDEELRKINHHIRRNRGELLFAQCWLLVEGETDVSVFTECADLLNFDLNAKGIRAVEYSQAGGPSVFIKIADALGIHWHVVADNDRTGQKFAMQARKLLNNRSEAQYVTTLSHPNIEILLCRSGFGKPYEDSVASSSEHELENFSVGSAKYWEKVYSIVNSQRSTSKPALALEALLIMQEKGQNSVPTEVASILAVLAELSGYPE